MVKELGCTVYVVGTPMCTNYAPLEPFFILLWKSFNDFSSINLMSAKHLSQLLDTSMSV